MYVLTMLQMLTLALPARGRSGRGSVLVDHTWDGAWHTWFP